MRSLIVLFRLVVLVIAGTPLMLIWLATACQWKAPGVLLGNLVDWTGKDET